MKTLIMTALLLSSTHAYADSIGIANCYNKVKQTSVELSYLPEDPSPPANKIAIDALMIEHNTGAVISSGKEVYSDLHQIHLVAKTDNFAVYAGKGFKLVVKDLKDSKGVNSHLKFVSSTGAVIEQDTSCQVY